MVTPSVPTPVTVLLVRPTGSKGGGMMRVADYLESAPGVNERGLRFLTCDVRGDVPLAVTPLTFLRQAVRMRALARSGRIDLVHLFVGDGLSALRKSLFARIALKQGLPLVLHLHAGDLPGTLASIPQFLRRFIASTFSRAHAVVTLGPAAADLVVARFGVDPSRVFVVPNGVKAPADTAGRAARRSDRILFCGNLSEDKGVSVLLRAFASESLRRQDARLLLAGGGDVPRYRRVAEALGVADRVEFLGWQERDSIGRLMLECRALVLPSAREALPLVVLEAFGHGLPCIATPLGELPHYAKDTDAVSWVEPGDTAGLAAAIQELLGNDRLATQRSLAGRALHERHFTMARFVDGLCDAYAAALNGRIRGSASCRTGASHSIEGAR